MIITPKSFSFAATFVNLGFPNSANYYRFYSNQARLKFKFKFFFSNYSKSKGSLQSLSLAKLPFWRNQIAEVCNQPAHHLYQLNFLRRNQIPSDTIHTHSTSSTTVLITYVSSSSKCECISHFYSARAWLDLIAFWQKSTNLWTILLSSFLENIVRHASVRLLSQLILFAALSRGSEFFLVRLFALIPQLRIGRVCNLRELTWVGRVFSHKARWRLCPKPGSWLSRLEQRLLWRLMKVS